MAKTVGQLKRNRRRSKPKKIVVRHADGRTEVVKQGHFDKKKRQSRPPSKRTAYRLYLKSDHWKRTRAATLKRDGYRCTRCRQGGRAVALEVHHLTYERLGEELPADLVTLCQPCHSSIHKGGWGPSRV